MGRPGRFFAGMSGLPQSFPQHQHQFIGHGSDGRKLATAMGHEQRRRRPAGNPAGSHAHK